MTTADNIGKKGPLNPANNINYTVEESGLETAYPAHPGGNRQPFFYTVPTLREQPSRAALSGRLSSIKFSSTLSPTTTCFTAWTTKPAAILRGVLIGTTTSRSGRSRRARPLKPLKCGTKWDVRGETHRATFDHPEQYSFIDISQNSWKREQTNWDHAQWVWQYIAAQPRPINSTKIYGAQTHKNQSRGIDARHATECFWRNLIGGFASSRFHRPDSGLGLSPQAQAHIRSGRLLSEVFDFFNAEPDSDSALLSDRAANEAYLSRVPGRQYALYFTDGGSVGLDFNRDRRNPPSPMARHCRQHLGIR